MSDTYILTVLSPDRPRIIAEITATAAQHQARVLEMSQTVVRHYFTVTAVLALPPALDSETLGAAVQGALGEAATVTLVALGEANPPAPSHEVYILTLMGDDDASALVAITETLAAAGGNIVDFSAQSNCDGMQVIAEVELPRDCPVDQLQIDLQHAGGGDERLQARLQHQRLFQATNEIAFRRIDHL